MRVQPETWSASLRHYRSKLCLLYLLWSLSPLYPSRYPERPVRHDLAAGPPVCTVPSPLLPSADGVLRVEDGMGEAVAGRTEAPVRMVSRHLQAVPITPPFDSTSADLSERRDSGNAIPASSSPSTRMPVKGSTSRDVNTSSGWTVTLSDRAPTVSAADKPDSPQREGPLPNSQQVQDRAAGTAPEEPEGSTCASPPEPSASAAPPSPAPLPRLTPLHVTLFYLHALYATRLVLRATRDSIATALVANPLPPPFAPTPASASFIKRVGRMHWRIRTIKRRCGAGILAWLVTTCSLVAFLSQASSGSAGALGWNAVACPAYVVDLRLAEGLGGVDAGARGWKPFRNVILLELLGTLVQSLLAITPLLVSLGWMPASVSTSFLLHQTTTPSSLRPAPSYRLPTDNFLSTIVSPFATNLFTILQVLQLVLARSPSHRWLSFSTLVVLNAILLPLEKLAVVRDKKAIEAQRVCKLAMAFPRHAAQADAAIRDAQTEATCLICFGGAFEPESTVGGRRKVTFSTACELPCGHSFHAACLARWFALVSTCPACHRSALDPTSLATSAPLALSASTATGGSNERAEQPLELPFAGGSGVRDSTDEYPGAAAMRRREERRAQLVPTDQPM